MTIAAVPAYLGNNFDTAPPGHRFSLYLEAYEGSFSIPKNKVPIVQRALPAPPDSAKALEALRTRQLSQAQDQKAEVFEALATAPFATGLGMEHPLENGFAFLNPYGLPYLPGSGVKGVMRAAARELARGDFGGTEGWTLEHIEKLFGSEDESLMRGALIFWDVIPTLPGNKMRVDVMTPHQTHYYQDGKTPHDSGQPVPIPFLTVPPGAQFRFIVGCEEKYLKDDVLKGELWKKLLMAAFEHAYEWLGFGAKTAVGYGAMQRDEVEENRQRDAREQAAKNEQKRQADAQRQAQLAALSPVDRKIAEARTAKQAGQSDDSAVFAAIKAGAFAPEEVREAAAKLKSLMQGAKTWKETTAAKKPEKDKEHQRTLEVMKWLAA